MPEGASSKPTSFGGFPSFTSSFGTGSGSTVAKGPLIATSTSSWSSQPSGFKTGDSIPASAVVPSAAAVVDAKSSSFNAASAPPPFSAPKVAVAPSPKAASKQVAPDAAAVPPITFSRAPSVSSSDSAAKAKPASTLKANKPARTPEPPERRVDPQDGQLYTRNEFFEFYGRDSEWEEADRSSNAPPPAAAQTKAAAPKPLSGQWNFSAKPPPSPQHPLTKDPSLATSKAAPAVSVSPRVANAGTPKQGTPRGSALSPGSGARTAQEVSVGAACVGAANGCRHSLTGCNHPRSSVPSSGSAKKRPHCWPSSKKCPSPLDRTPPSCLRSLWGSATPFSLPCLRQPCEPRP